MAKTTVEMGLNIFIFLCKGKHCYLYVCMYVSMNIEGKRVGCVQKACCKPHTHA